MKTILKKKKKDKPAGKHKVEKKIEEQQYADSEGINIAEELDKDSFRFIDEGGIDKNEIDEE